MPLLMCPNCNQSMSCIQRQQVEFDMCPGCRGVWLDRGELEKLLEAARAEMGEGLKYGDYDRRSERSRFDRSDDDDRYRKRKRGFDLFDIFD